MSTPSPNRITAVVALTTWALAAAEDQRARGGQGDQGEEPPEPRVVVQV